MLTEAFDRCFKQLLAAARRYYAAPRDPERVAELASARWNLEIARRDVANARSQPSATPITFRRRGDDETEAARHRLRVQSLGFTTS